jgi:hypothetical protein
MCFFFFYELLTNRRTWRCGVSLTGESQGDLIVKQFNRNWDYITSEKLNVGDLVWWNFGASYDTDWVLCIITDTNLDKADQKTTSDWVDYLRGPNGRYNPNEELRTNFVANTSREKCKFNSITMMCPQKSHKLVVLLHPTYKERGWKTRSLEDFFMTQNQKVAKDAARDHRTLCRRKKKELIDWWREENADFFDVFDKECEEANAGRARPRAYYAYDWLDGAWRNHLADTYDADKKVYEDFMKSLESKSASALDVLNGLNNLIPDRLEVKQFTNGVEIDDGKVKGRIDVKWRWSMEKTQQWFEDYLNKDFAACELKVRNWMKNNCSEEVMDDLINKLRTMNDLAFTPQWFWENVLSHHERQWMNKNPDKTLRCSEHPNVIGNGNAYQTSGWNYDID